MGDYSLFKIDGKPIEKLIDVISQGIGTIYKPRAIRNEAEAKAYEIEVIENAKAKAHSNGKLIELETYEKIQSRILHKETKRQLNIDNVSQVAAQQLAQASSVSEEPVNEDWTTRFFNIVEDVSDEEMQQLWGRILAGEVKQPKSYSLRTLDLLKNLTKREAEVFTKASAFVIISNNSPFLFKGENNEVLDNYGLSFEDRLLLIETGLLQPESNISRGLKQKSEDSLNYFQSGKFIIKVLKKASTPENRIEIYRFTKIGEELLQLLSTPAIDEYVKDFCFRLEKFQLEVMYAHILTKQGDILTHTDPWLKFNAN